MVKLTFLGATGTVTGSKYLVEADGRRVLVDCGLFQGMKELRLRNWDKLPVLPHSIHDIILTHAHLDHSGYIPLLIKQGFHGRIFCTQGTKDLCEILLPDSGYIQEEDAKFANKHGYSKHHPAKPLYTREEGADAIAQFHPERFGKRVNLSDNLSFSFSHAGHILGAASVTLYTSKGSFFFSGDIGRPNDLLFKAPEPFKGADYVVVESTYGDRLHEKTDPLDELEAIINQTASKGGTVIIPAFAVGRAQLLLYLCFRLKQEGRINKTIPIFLDSPMAIDVTHLMKIYRSEHKLNDQECEMMCHIASYVQTVEQSKVIDNLSMPSVIISASGMATGGRVLHHLSHYAPDSKNTILLAGFQAAGTRGDRLKQGEKEIKIHGQMVTVRANVVELGNMSAHADYEEILAWLAHAQTKPRQVFVTHGEASAAESFRDKIEQRLKWNAVVPLYMESVNL